MKNVITTIEREDYTLVTQTMGPTLGYSRESGVKILNIDGLAFKDLNRDGTLEPYEDWRLPAHERANARHAIATAQIANSDKNDKSKFT